jgi:hypothetical protein
VTGQAFDVETGVKEVKVRVDSSRFEHTTPDIENGWLLWSALVPVDSWKDGDHDVVARATDNANHTKRETVTLATQ